MISSICGPVMINNFLSLYRCIPVIGIIEYNSEVNMNSQINTNKKESSHLHDPSNYNHIQWLYIYYNIKLNNSLPFSHIFLKDDELFISDRRLSCK